MYNIRLPLIALPVIWATLGIWANPAPSPVPAATPDVALKSLTDGNARYVSGTATDSHRDQNRRCETVTGGQHPIAAVLACADSRAPVELIFDQGIGDLFVIRVAGNVADTNEIGTLEYGIGHLGVSLIVVLGHTNCGAVTAVVEKATAHGNVAGLLAHITPAADKARAEQPNAKPATLLNAAIRLNVWQSIEDICAKSPEIRAAAKAGKVKIVGGVYDLHSGTVQILGPHPQQDQLLTGEPKPIASPTTPAGEHAPATPAHAAEHAPAAPVEHAPVKSAEHAPATPANHGPTPAKPATPPSHSQDTHELIHDAATPTHAAAPTTQPAPATAEAPVNKQSRTLALAGLITGSAVLSVLLVHIVRTHR